MVNLFKTEPDFCCNHDLRRCTLEYTPYITNDVVSGDVKPIKIECFCTDERILSEDVPQGLLKYEVRGKDTACDEWSTIELSVRVNHAATIITDTPIEMGVWEINGKPDRFSYVVSYDIDYDPDLDNPDYE